MPKLSLGEPLRRLFQLFVHVKCALVISKFLMQCSYIQQSELPPVPGPRFALRTLETLHGFVISGRRLRVFRLVVINTAQIVKYGYGCLSISRLAVQTKCRAEFLCGFRIFSRIHKGHSGVIAGACFPVVVSQFSVNFRSLTPFCHGKLIVAFRVGDLTKRNEGFSKFVADRPPLEVMQNRFINVARLGESPFVAQCRSLVELSFYILRPYWMSRANGY